jgi:hypothetical protein
MRKKLQVRVKLFEIYFSIGIRATLFLLFKDSFESFSKVFFRFRESAKAIEATRSEAKQQQQRRR